MLLKLYWPAVSHICSFTLQFQSISNFFEANSTPSLNNSIPIVTLQSISNQSLVQRVSRQLLPVPESPIIISLNIASLTPEVLRLLFMISYCYSDIINVRLNIKILRAGEIILVLSGAYFSDKIQDYGRAFKKTFYPFAIAA